MSKQSHSTDKIYQLSLDDEIIDGVARAICGPSYDDKDVQAMQGEYYRNLARDAIKAYEELAGIVNRNRKREI